MSKLRESKLVSMVATGVVAALGVAVITFAATTISTNINTGGTLTVSGLSSLGNASTTILSTTGNFMVNGFATTTASNGNIATAGTLTVAGASTLTGTVATGGKLGVASSSPWGMLSVESVAGTVNASTPIFVVGDQGTSSPIMYISARGSIGIGTTTPEKVYGLDLVSNGYGRVLTVSDVGASSALSIDGTTAEIFLTDNNAPANTRIFWLKNTNGQLQFQSMDDSFGSTAFMTMDATSYNVSIGDNTDPYSKLQVTGSGTGNGQLFALVDSASTTVLQVLDNGKVGIGTTSPSQRLSIHGNALVSGNVAVANVTATGTIGVATSTPSTEFSATGSATTTLSLYSSGSLKGGCIQLQSPVDGSMFRAYATTAGPLYLEAGSCK